MAQEVAAPGPQRPAPAPLALIGPPGAGCRSVAAAVARLRGQAVADVAGRTAEALGVAAEHALVAVGEQAYRRAEAAAVVEALAEALEPAAAGQEGAGGAPGGGVVLALGSGWVDQAEARRALEAFRAGGGRVVALGAQGRVLASRNGLNAPRSVALGPVHHQFISMLRQREEACRALAETVIDTSTTSPEQAARRVLEHLGTPS
ncbi:shikimate kinase [Actinomyces bowdenii]|uniref:Shikimate kinase n=1 Tax=Actinomyces bowdenii TaxID=131109 RepID=A0A853EHF8_9ACTO|nr:shikimate kinase [Actinomyces bowdenii]MBF0696421.1 shikimate kinase [Actinomyces bowdenii]NYS68594.1 shikimate kinase [Actinomyces bowdenii]